MNFCLEHFLFLYLLVLDSISALSEATGADVTEVEATSKREASAANFLELFNLLVLAIPNSHRYVGCNGTAVAIAAFSNPW